MSQKFGKKKTWSKINVLHVTWKKKKHEQERLELKLLLRKRFRKRGSEKNRKYKLNPLANAGATAITST